MCTRRERLVPGGWLVVEHGYDQTCVVLALFHAAGFRYVLALRDLAGISRVVAGGWDMPNYRRA